MSNAPKTRVAIIGAGPSGFFVAEELLRHDNSISVEIFERLNKPYGLLQYGVAPDHPHTRRIITLMKHTATRPGFKLNFGLEIGRDITIEELRAKFDALFIATGAEVTHTLGIPGEDLPGVHSARAFAAWVNNHPDHAGDQFDFNTETAVIIGNGNVALDLVRILSRNPASLEEFPFSDAAREALARSRVKNIHVIGRRGPAQSSFEEKELLELGTFPDIDLRIDPVITMLGPTDEQELAAENADRARAIVETLRKYASRPGPANPRTTVSFDFLRRPIAIKGKERPEEITLELCRLEGEAGQQRSVPTGALQRLACGLVFISIGQRGKPIPGLPFDDVEGIIPTKDHHVLMNGQPLPDVYAVGWLKRGAHGLIGNNRKDAMLTAQTFFQDQARRQAAG